MKYTIRITRVETYTKEVEVEADSAQEADDMVTNSLNSGEIADFDCPDDVETHTEVEAKGECLTMETIKNLKKGDIVFTRDCPCGFRVLFPEPERKLLTVEYIDNPLSRCTAEYAKWIGWGLMK